MNTIDAAAAVQGAGPGSFTPRIGITTYAETVSWSVWNRAAVLLPTEYPEMVAAAGGVPLLLPPSPGLAAAAVDSIDGLIVSGGPDVDPRRYGATPHATTGPPRPERDDWEIALLEAALERDLPVLAICRGMQLMNVVYGGTLHQDVPEVTGTSAHQPALGTFATVRPSVLGASLLSQIIDPQVDVRCHHHQAVAELGDGLTVSALADDGVVEAFEDPTKAFAIGVQWHPEESSTDVRLVSALCHAAADRRAELQRKEAS